MMSKRHYDAFAKALRDCEPATTEKKQHDLWIEFRLAIIEVLLTDNPKFQIEHFLIISQNSNMV